MFGLPSFRLGEFLPFVLVGGFVEDQNASGDRPGPRNHAAGAVLHRGHPAVFCFTPRYCGLLSGQPPHGRRFGPHGLATDQFRDHHDPTRHRGEGALLTIRSSPASALLPIAGCAGCTAISNDYTHRSPAPATTVLSNVTQLPQILETFQFY